LTPAAANVLVAFMSAVANAPDPSTQLRRSASLLGLVRKLIDYGRELAATIRRRAFTDPISVGCCFGTADAALILARISRGLHRANALEERLLRNANRLDTAPQGGSSPAQPRAPRPATAPAACETDARLAHLPTPEQIAAKSAASRSAPSSPTSAATSASCPATHSGGNCRSPSSERTATSPAW
jgi:hypothetical protein